MSNEYGTLKNKVDKYYQSAEWDALSEDQQKRFLDFAVICDLLEVPEPSGELQAHRKWSLNIEACEAAKA